MRPPEHPVADEIFFRLIAKWNDEGRMGQQGIVILPNNEAMHVYWGRCGWDRDVYPIIKP